MGTRSFVGVQQPDGSIVSMYVHWDGYPAGVGQVLLQHYNNHALAADLVQLGYASDLLPTKAETAAKAANRQAPGRSRSVPGYLRAAGDWDAEWAYLWQGDRWLYARVDAGGFTPLNTPA